MNLILQGCDGVSVRERERVRRVVVHKTYLTSVSILHNVKYVKYKGSKD